ncbi:MAG: hypothetical protein C0467_06110 [Planctomycetaceae bacterium]|nr:hypothetical protein [Planctomycetaceae bacterium]
MTVTYEAVKSGAHNTAKVSAETRRATELDFSYAMAGSVVFVFTVPQDRDVLGDSHMNEAVRLVFEAGAATSARQIKELVPRIGVPPIRALYTWAKAHAQFGLGADLKWLDKGDQPQHVEINSSEFRLLAEVIEGTGDEKVTEQVYTGDLEAANKKKSTFQLHTDNDEEIRGSAGTVILRMGTVVVGDRYKARVLKKSKIKYATEKETITYELLELTPLTPPPPLSPRTVPPTLFDAGEE